jgi:hypothetical protein
VFGEKLSRKINASLHQCVLKSIAGGSTARGHPDLAINRLQMAIHGAGANHQRFGHLGIGQPLGH